MPPSLPSLTTLRSSYLKQTLLRRDWEQCFPKTEEDGQYHPVTYGSLTLTIHVKNYHFTKLEFFVLKWAITEHFKEYLLY